MLQYRRSERETLDGLLQAVRAGESRVLVLRGEAGVGKSALLEHLVERAADCRVARAVGVQSEMELAFAGLHQVCAPMLDQVERLPDPQREALAVAFGLSTGAAPDRFLVALAVLGLLAEVAEERPLVCVVDDAHWLDRASAQALGFVARRLGAESVGLVFAAREAASELAGLPELVVEGLAAAEARALLGSVISGPLDERVRDRIVAETRGNPLALLELPRGLSAAELAGGFGLDDAPALSGRIEESFRRRLRALPQDSQRLLLVAAAEPVGDPVVVWRAAEQLGITAPAATAAAATAASAGLLQSAAQVRFRHPLVRSAIYQAAPLEDRQAVHAALAQVTDPEADADRRAWHRAHAARGPDDDVAAELERSAGRAQARGGLAAAAAFLERAAGLTLDPTQRAQRALAAAQAKHQAGAPDAALELLTTAQAGPLNELQRAEVDLLRAQIALALSRGRDAPPLLLKAARRLEPLDVALARETYLEAFSAAVFAGRLASGGGLLEVAEAARSAGRAGSSPDAPRAVDLLLDGFAVQTIEGHAAGAPALRRALSAFHSEQLPRGEGLRWLWLASHAAMSVWDDESWYVLSARHVQLAREAGALTMLPLALTVHADSRLFAGEFAAAEVLREEARGVCAAIGAPEVIYNRLGLAGWRGRQPETAELIEAAREAAARGEGRALSAADYAAALLYNGLGRYDDALLAAQQVSGHPEDLVYATWGLVELIEAAARSGRADLAAAALERLSESTRAGGTDWALGIEAHARALLSEGQVAEDLYLEAIDRLGRTRIATYHARSHLLYGEWLRRENRRAAAREQLRTAHDMLTTLGIEAFAARAARELFATGETARKRTPQTSGQLTAREAQIARLARDGLSNPEIGARLYISRRTVEYHLRKIFTKLDITSRQQLHGVLASEPDAAQTA